MILATDICDAIRAIADESTNTDWNHLSLKLYQRVLEVIPDDYISYVIRESQAAGYRYELELVIPSGKFKYMVM
jgi:hypothetical protein